MKKNEPIRVAQIMGKMVGGGVESFVMNYYRNINKSKVQFDFIIDEDSTYIPREEIELYGGRIIEIPPYQHIFKYMKVLIRLFKENKYIIVHSNINTLSIFPLFCAKLANVPVRIAHSHSTTNKKEWKKNIIKAVLKPFSKVFANEYFACTEHAGRWLFGNKFFDSGRVKVINNAIDTCKFDYNEEIRNRVRKDLDIENKFVIGHVGRFSLAKNHDRIIDIFDKYYNQNKNSVLLLVGDGNLRESIQEKVKELGLDKIVFFLGQREDVNELFQAMDCFLFPSLYEGFGMVLIEAQCSGLLCIASSEVPEVTKVTNNIKYISLEEDNTNWCKIINNEKLCINRKSCIEDVIKNGYDIETESKKLEKYYLEKSVL